jgi:chemotaxis response regulator CheB
MPKVAFEIGATERQLPIEKIGGAIIDLTNRQERP